MRISALLVFAVAFVARICVQIFFGAYERPESWEQDIVARNIVSGRGFELDYLGTVYRALVAPAYPLLLAGLYAAFGTGAAAVGLLQALTGAALALTVQAIALRAGLGVLVAAAAGVLVGLHPGLLTYSAKVHPLTFDALLVALGVLLLQRARTSHGSRLALLLGLLTGIIALERLSLVPLIALALAALLVLERWRPERVRFVAVVAVVSLALLVPWLVRNVAVVGAPTVVTAGGLALWLGNNATGNAGATTPDGIPVIDTVPAVRDAIVGRLELEQEAVLRAAALEYIAADPGRAALNVIKRTFYFWWASPSSGALYPARWATVYLAYYASILLFAIPGALLIVRGNRWLAFLLGLTFATVTAAHAASYVEGRHRWGIEGLLLLLTAAGAVALLERIRPGVLRREGGDRPAEPD